MGFDENRSIGRKEYGNRAALPIWIEFMKEALKGVLKSDFERPEGVVTAKIDPVSGLLAFEEMENPLEELFIEGTVPTETALPPDTLSLDDFVLEQTSSGQDNSGNRAQVDAGVRPRSPEELKKSLIDLLDRNKRLD